MPLSCHPEMSRLPLNGSAHTPLRRRTCGISKPQTAWSIDCWNGFSMEEGVVPVLEPLKLPTPNAPSSMHFDQVYDACTCTLRVTRRFSAICSALYCDVLIGCKVGKYPNAGS